VSERDIRNVARPHLVDPRNFAGSKEVWVRRVLGGSATGAAATSGVLHGSRALGTRAEPALIIVDDCDLADAESLRRGARITRGL